MEGPLVSVVIDNYNYTLFLRESIESVLHQSYPHVELVIVDDGSSDSSPQIIEEYRYHPQIKIVLKENGGQASAFNAGILHCEGDIICFLDSDDYFYPMKIDRVVQLFKEYPQAGWLSHPLEWVFANGNARPNFTTALPLELKDFRRAFRLGSIRGNFSATSALCFRKELVEQIFPIPEELRITADNYIKYAAAGISPMILVGECLAVQRIHGLNAYTLNAAKTSREIEIHLTIAEALYHRFPNSRLLSFRLAGRYLGLALQNWGWEKSLQRARQVSKSLEMPLFFGCGMLLGWGWLGSLKRRITGILRIRK